MQPTLKGPGMAPYVVTADDALWLSRAVEAEGPPQPQVAATLINGFCWARATKGYRGSLTTWVRAYAQPVNPRWYPDGDLFQKSIEKLSQPQKIAQIATAAKRATTHSTRTSFSAGTKAAVTAALAGLVKFDPKTTDYAVHSLDASKKGYAALSPAQPGVNRLWARPGTQSWPGYVVDAAEQAASAVASAVASAKGSILPWVIGAIALGAAFAFKGKAHG